MSARPNEENRLAFRRWALSLGILLALLVQTLADETDYLFRNTNLIRIQIEITDLGMQKLMLGRDPRARSFATVVEGGVVYTNVSVHLKGRGTFQPITGRPNLTLHFGEAAPHTFHGLHKISLNNSSQDPTCLQEKLARELFAAAGVPVARADQAFVTLNGRRLGVYVLTEGYDKTFLKKHFEDENGAFFDGGLFTDVNRRLDVVSGDKHNWKSLEQAFQATLMEQDAARFDAIEKAVDLEPFFSLLAMETILCHFDGYAMRGTNYRVYHDPSTDKLVFMPQGMDRILGNFRRHLDLPVAPPMVGLVARALIGTEKGRAQFVERVGTLYTNLFRSEDLVRHVRELDRKIAPEISETKARWGRNRGDISTVPVASLGEHAKDVDEFCERIVTRAALLGNYLADRPQIDSATPLLSFVTNNVAKLSSWSPRAAYLRPSAKWEQVAVDGTNCWHLVNSGKFAALGCRVRLPAGTYLMSGRVKAATNAAPRIMLRHFFMPFTEEHFPTEWQRVHCAFEISRGAAPQEVDLLWEFRGQGEAWFQPNSFAIRRAADIASANAPAFLDAP